MRIGRLLAIGLMVAFPSLGMFVLPAALLWVLGGFRTLDRFTKGVYCIFFGVSCWTWLPWLTRYIPISLPSLIWVVVLALAGPLLFLGQRGKGQACTPAVRLGKGTSLLLVILTAVIVLARLLPTVSAIVPPGPDMSMHAYNARLIMDSDSIPRTQRPLLPIDSFGEYPIGFAVLAASTSLMAGMNVQDSALLWTGLSYVLLHFGLFLLLRVWFGPAVSLGTAAMAAFLTFAPQSYSEWGGNPTVLSFAFILAALGLFFSLKEESRFPSLLVQASFWAAALLIHSISFLGAAYFLLAFGLCFSARAVVLKRAADLKSYAVRCALAIAIALVLVAPFLAGYSVNVSDNEIAWVKWWQRDADHVWHGTIHNCLWVIPLFVDGLFRHHVLGFAILGLFLSTLTWRIRLSVVLSSIVLLALTLNSQYWLLPFSYALYPERMAMMLLAPMSVLWAGLVDRLVVFAAESRLRLTQASKASARHRISRVLPLVCASLALLVVLLRVVSQLLGAQWLDLLRFRHVLPLIFALVLFQVWSLRRERKLALGAVGLSVIGIAACIVAGLCWDFYNQFYARHFSPRGSVTQDDMRAFEWIKQNTSRADTILNVAEHDYSGLWIPALCGRRILNPASNPFYFDELAEGNRDVIPTYLFVGSQAMLYRCIDCYWLERARASPCWKELATFGRAGIFKLQAYRGRINWRDISQPTLGPFPRD
ncbi:MAG: hypothetical protein JW759_00805 [Candidatus Coatesbacteria bacterium]|nr:hypothetical protein [Candidatus Coatesbacteria bacterium]